MLPAHYSDILRLQLLYKYGGIWADSTVFVTGRRPEFENFLNVPFFMFNHDGNFEEGLFSDWMKSWFNSAYYIYDNYFIVSDKDHPIVKLILDLHYQYWRDYNRPIDYFIFHMMLKMVCEKYKDISDAVPKFPNHKTLILGVHLTDEYSESFVNKAINISDFHKLSYKSKETPSENSIYSHIIRSV